METRIIKYPSLGFKSTIINFYWGGEDDNDAEDFVEEWLPQDAW